MGEGTSRKYRKRVSQSRGSEGDPSVIVGQVSSTQTSQRKKTVRKVRPKKGDFEVGFEILLQGTKAMGETLQRAAKWLGKVNKGRWSDVLIQWLILFALGFLVGFLYGWWYV